MHSRLLAAVTLSFVLFIALFLLFPGLGTGNAGVDGRNAPRIVGRADTPTNGLGLKVSPMPDWFQFKSNDVVNGWIDEHDGKSMTSHAWDIWGAITTLTDQTLNEQKVPVFETWWDRDEALTPAGVLAASRKKNTRVFERPRQLSHTSGARRDAAARPTTTLFDNVKYNDDIRNHIQKNKYFDSSVLGSINSGWGNSKPIAERKLLDFPNTSVMLKPVYRAVSGTGPTILTYWAGPVNSTTPATPAPSTWTKKMVVIPPGLGLTAANFRLSEAEEFLPAVPLSDFYNFKLTKDEADVMNQQLGTNVKAGDYAILVAMHVSTREIDNWTWQTFWWSLDKSALPASAKNRVLPPFDHYEVAVGYSFMTDGNKPNSLTLTCYNPYLEAGFGNDVFEPKKGQLGIESNCMSCHRAAAWPADDNTHYVANGIVDPADPLYFAGRTKTDFLWGIPFGVNLPATPNP